VKRCDADSLIDWILGLMLDFEDKPYTDTRISDTEWIREFDPAVTDSEEYVWHRDLKDRTVIVLEGNDWKFQFDDDLPKVINKDNRIFIPKGVYHRLIPGTEKLKIIITETEK
jgi:hypothetical protein